ncbi:unnamed protein product [marine sediment metagenome]|uniref:Uncharacterized protein n=1 Tax=marine sediment metagenome TaxID=412755 RepID=X1H9E6_9ZZZZ
MLDLFAGSGALGIEALSRGAGWVDFVEHKPRCCGIIRQNLEKTKLTAQASAIELTTGFLEAKASALPSIIQFTTISGRNSPNDSWNAGRYA